MNKRVYDLEFRIMEGRHPEIVQWITPSEGKPYCFPLLWFIKDNEGYHIEFVGDRPLKYSDTNALWKMMNYGQSVCQAMFDLEEE